MLGPRILVQQLAFKLINGLRPKPRRFGPHARPLSILVLAHAVILCTRLVRERMSAKVLAQEEP